jgi:protein O-mannosyl-transferase
MKATPHPLKAGILRFFNSPGLTAPFLVILAACVLAYGPSLHNGFMLDDNTVLFGERGVENKTFLSLFTERQYIFYRPVGHIFLLGCYKLFGHNPVGYHVANLLLFSGIVFLFFRIVEALFHNRALAYLTAFFYCVHPFNNMLVNYITANIIGTFVLTIQLSFLFFIRYLDTNKKGVLGISLFCFALSLLSHEMSIVYPAYVFCLLYFLKNYRWQRAVFVSLPFFLLFFAYFVFRMIFFTLKGTLNVVAKLMTVFTVYISYVMSLIYWYVSRLFFPRDTLFLWASNIEKDYFPLEAVRFLVIAAILVYFIFIRWKKGLKAFALAFFVAGFVPVFWASFAHFPFAEPFIEPHWFYFSSFGFFLLAADGLLRLKGIISSRIWKAFVASIFLACFIWLQQNNGYWKDQETYCRYWLSLNTRNITPYYGLGRSLLEKKQYGPAIKSFEKCLDKNPLFNAGFITADLGYAYFLNGQMDKARQYLDLSAWHDPQDAKTYYYLGLFYAEKGDVPKARQAFAKAAQLYPKNKEYQKMLDSYPLKKR